MKKIAPILIVLVFVIVIVSIFLSLGKTQHMVVIKEGNLKQLPLKIELHKYQDSYCGMIIDELSYASQVVAKDGKTWFFHDHGDFVLWLENKPFKDEVKIWVMSRDTNKWIDAKEAYYSRNEITPMGFGFGAYEQKKEHLVTYGEMKLFTLRGETMLDPKIRKILTDK
ncbi:hypothetical protein [Sulfurimonas marina]|uniref:Uncharacterized protein n=1 Tax=Sulfurimonas marina TaxID=2590551 RepID=A0A7M1AYT5_9BACT|nr:hypothetical protein [Sulfurimonas marina]QOP41542.1 hypothetical protein FJR03_07200 [Sulfurimonas marina]